MFHDLKDAWKEVLKNATHIVYGDEVTISIPADVFALFEQEFNICFVDPEDDAMFKAWQNTPIFKKLEGNEDER
jgi:hypothetical protein